MRTTLKRVALLMAVLLGAMGFTVGIAGAAGAPEVDAVSGGFSGIPVTTLAVGGPCTGSDSHTYATQKSKATGTVSSANPLLAGTVSLSSTTTQDQSTGAGVAVGTFTITPSDTTLGKVRVKGTFHAVVQGTDATHAVGRGFEDGTVQKFSAATKTWKPTGQIFLSNLEFSIDQSGSPTLISGHFGDASTAIPVLAALAKGSCAPLVAVP